MLRKHRFGAKLRTTTIITLRKQKPINTAEIKEENISFDLISFFDPFFLTSRQFGVFQNVEKIMRKFAGNENISITSLSLLYLHLYICIPNSSFG